MWMVFDLCKSRKILGTDNYFSHCQNLYDQVQRLEDLVDTRTKVIVPIPFTSNQSLKSEKMVINGRTRMIHYEELKR